MRRTVPMVTMLVMVAACGGDGTGAGEAPTKSEWIAAADAICAEDNAELARIPAPQTPEEMSEAGVRAAAIQRAGLAEVQALTPPDGDEATVEAILDAVAAVIEWGEEFSEAVAAGDDVKASELHADGERLTAEAIRLAGDYGLRECIEPGE